MILAVWSEVVNKSMLIAVQASCEFSAIAFNAEPEGDGLPSCGLFW